MIRRLLAVIFIGSSSCTAPAAQVMKGGSQASPPALTQWKNDLPPLGNVNVEDFKPALEWAMAQKRTAVEQIAAVDVPATFKNTIEPFERAGLALADVRARFGFWGRSFRTDAFDAIEEEMQPRVAAFEAKTLQNAKLRRAPSRAKVRRQRSANCPVFEH